MARNSRRKEEQQTDEQRKAASAAYAAKERFEKRKAWFAMEMMRQEHNRYQMAIDEDYYDNLQWTPEEARAIRARGQDPTVYNEVFPAINWLIGTERRMRRDFKVLARHDNSPAASDDADVKTKLLKYLEDVNRAPFERSSAAASAWKGGMGWIEVGVRSDPEDEMIYKRSESWRHMLYDSLAAKPDFSDGRFMFRFREVDVDIAKAYFPGKEAEIDRASRSDGDGTPLTSWAMGWPTSGMLGDSQLPAKWMAYDATTWTFNPRKRVLLIECWNTEPTRETTGQGPNTHDSVRMKMHVSIMTEFDTLLEAESPYKHNRFPFIPVWAYRRMRDGAPYGPIRVVRSQQDGVNKFFSKSRFLMSVNQLLLEEDAIDPEVMDAEEIRDELAAPDGIVRLKKGALSQQKVQVRDHKDLAAGHLQLAQQTIGAIRSTMGINEENRGLQSSATSRVAMDAKADRGSVVTSELFDQLMYSHQLEGELTLSLIEQFYTERKVFSIAGERFKLNYHVINDVDPVTGKKVNDVTRFKQQFVIGDAPWRQSLAAAAFDSAMTMLGQLAPVAPQVVVSIIDLVFEWSDLPNKTTILQRIRQATGMSDPDEGDSPEQQQQKAQQAALAQKEYELQMAQMRATIREAQAKGDKLDAEAVSKRLEALYMAAQAAQVLAAAASVAPIADELARSAGFKDQAAAGEVIDMPADAAPALPGPEQQPTGGTVGPDAQAPMPELQQTDGARQGIETPEADGVVGLSQ